MKPIRTISAAFFALGLATLSALAADPTGTWKFSVQRPNGQIAEATLTLKLENNQLTGTLENRAGKIDISNAVFANDEVSFSVVRKFRRREFTVNYQGRIEGDTITGNIEAPRRGNGPVTIPWEAKRAE